MPADSRFKKSYLKAKIEGNVSKGKCLPISIKHIIVYRL